MTSAYVNAPVVEVVAEFHFNPIAEWDLLLPGRIHHLVSAEFPKSRQLNVIGGVRLSAGPSGVGQQILPQARVQFLRKDDSAMIQLGPNLLAINHLRPYIDWAAQRTIWKVGCDESRMFADVESRTFAD